MNHVSKAEYYKTYRNRVISSLKRFNKLLDAESLTKDDHYLTSDDLESAVSFTFPRSPDRDTYRGEFRIYCSSEDTPLSRLNPHFEYVQSCFNHRRLEAFSVGYEINELLWIGGEAEETNLARTLGVSRIVIRERSKFCPSFDGSEDRIFAGLDEQYHLTNRFHRWVLIIENRYRRTVRFDCVLVDKKRRSEEVVFSRYFISPNDLLSLVYAGAHQGDEPTSRVTHLSALKSAKRILAEAKLRSKSDTDKPTSRVTRRSALERAKRLLSESELHSKSDTDKTIKWSDSEADND